MSYSLIDTLICIITNVIETICFSEPKNGDWEVAPITMLTSNNTFPSAAYRVEIEIPQNVEEDMIHKCVNAYTDIEGVTVTRLDM